MNKIDTAGLNKIIATVERLEQDQMPVDMSPMTMNTSGPRRLARTFFGVPFAGGVRAIRDERPSLKTAG
ncbi:hypothetical protein ABT369_03625 [Dactylosporangium sp. NPDC000244]|uniref:hypothetical protein n=1 Tax=Dactylosporangium sp. NPDC000244 TaxID=3154365 RepID=UPI00331E14F0